MSPPDGRCPENFTSPGTGYAPRVWGPHSWVRDGYRRELILFDDYDYAEDTYQYKALVLRYMEDIPMRTVPVYRCSFCLTERKQNVDRGESEG